LKKVKEARLFFKEGKSDKVYNVDLCLIDNDQYVVNFRYGRRVSNLREGTKTVFPVSLEEANKIFDSLVISKTKKGYTNEGSTAITSTKNKIDSDRNIEREEAVLDYLSKGDNHDPNHWPMSRALWRAGELNLQNGSDIIVGYLNSSDSMEVYSAIWSLGRIGSDIGVQRIKNKLSEWSNTDKKYRLACAYVLKMGDEGDKQTILGSLMRQWPSELIDAVTHQKLGDFESLIYSIKSTREDLFSKLVTDLYLISENEIWLRPFILNLLKRLDFKPNFFKAIRYVYKLAEFSEDFETIALIGKRFYYASPYFNSQWDFTWIDGQKVDVSKELKKENSKLAYSAKTSTYFKNRVVKYLKRSIDFSNKNYIDLAKNILLTANEDADSLESRTERVFEYDYSIWQEIDKGVRFYPAYTDYSALMYVVYGNSQRYKNSKTGSWYIQDQNKEVSFDDVDREEPYPYLWDKYPKEVIDLLIKSESTLASNFALRIFKANNSFKSSIDTGIIIAFLSHKDKGTSKLGIELAKEIIDKGNVDADLVFALLSCKVKEGEELGLTYFINVKECFSNNQEYLIKALQSGNDFLFNSFTKSIENGVLNIDSFQSYSLVNINVFLTHLDEFKTEYFHTLSNALNIKQFGKLFSDLKPSEIQVFIESKDQNLIMLGLAFIGANKLPSYELAGEFILEMIQSDIILVQTSAIKLLADFPEVYFKDKQDLILSLALSELEAIRESTIPVLLKLVNLDSVFKDRLFNQLLIALCEKPKNDAFHIGCKNLLENHFSYDLKKLTKKQIFSLLFSPFELAQQLGEKLFFESFRISSLSNEELVELTSADPVKIRFSVIEYLERSIYKIKSDLEIYLNVLESEWEDVRNWSFDFFSRCIDDKSWSIDLIMRVCDSPLLDVQAFGRKLLIKVFNSEHGLALLLKLSEHPTDEMKLFTTNYITQFASGNPMIIKQLKPYFLSVLLSVNKNSVAKKRVVEFLKLEANKSEDIGKFTLKLIEGLLHSNTLSDKSNYLTLLIELKDKYSTLELPFEVVQTKVYKHEV
jgi:predicted DNA-binding WGR domain protein